MQCGTNINGERYQCVIFNKKEVKYRCMLFYCDNYIVRDEEGLDLTCNVCGHKMEEQDEH